jgi:hypothetical protein
VHASLLVLLALVVSKPIRSSLAIQVVVAPSDPPTVVNPPTELEIAPPAHDDPEPLPVDQSASWELQIDPLTPAPQAIFDTAGTARAEQLRANTRLGDDSPLAPGKARGAQFYGIQAPGSRFVFIVDSSASMQIKFHEAKRELEQAVCGLDEGQLFYVIFFDQKTKRLRLGRWTHRGKRFTLRRQPEKDLVPANDENIESLIHWMNTIELGPDTNPYPAVTYALRKLEPDAIFLLSDGEFRDGGRTEAFLKKENCLPTLPGPKTIVHCVGFYSRVGEITLERIAKDNGGTYRFINSPPEAMIKPAFGARFPRR